MDQMKIGGFIAARRKAKGWTQSQLAEALGITDKAVSKWETGRCMPDLSLFEPLCHLFKITLNELLAGELIADEDLKEKSNQVLLEVIHEWIGRDAWVMKPRDEEQTVLRLEHVKKVYDMDRAATVAVKDVTFCVAEGSFTGIMGASGCGKSTLLNMIATIDTVTDGLIEINGRNIAGLSQEDMAAFRREHLGFIFQEYNLLDTLTVYENIALALTVKQVPREAVQSVITDLTGRLKLEEVLHKFPYEISGGERQRCACARAIATNPDLILADEPTGALDSGCAKQLLETLSMLRQDFFATILMVTHDALAASYCDRILFMQDGEIKADLDRENGSRRDFFSRILDTMSKITEGAGHVC